MDSIDKLLAQVKAEYGEPAKTEEPKQQEPFPSSQMASAAPERETRRLPNRTRKSEPTGVDNLLDQLKSEYEEKDQAEVALRQQQFQAEELRQQQLRQQKQEVLQSRAREWLQKLDPLSGEGLWFERFAASYPSKLEAAIHYLEDLE